MRHMSRLWVAAVLLSGSAFASASYPNVLKSETGSSVTPQCTACHMDSTGGTGTVTQVFGVALVDQGLTGNSNFAKLKELLATFHQQGVDSDGDGTGDWDELAVGRNPSAKGPSDCFPGSTACGGSQPDGGGGGGTDGGPDMGALPPVTYGCSAGAGGGALAGLALAGAALVSALRRRRS